MQLKQVKPEDLKYNSDGLIPAIVQDVATKDVLMLAYMNSESVGRTMASGETWFWSRSRQEFWHKGESSGNVQRVKEMYFDCDSDTLLLLVEQKGAACDECYYGCFHYELVGDSTVTIKREPMFAPAEVYGYKK